MLVNLVMYASITCCLGGHSNCVMLLVCCLVDQNHVCQVYVVFAIVQLHHPGGYQGVNNSCLLVTSL